MSKPVTAVVLAAGKGTRMKSRRPKVLHELCGRSMLAHVLQTLRESGIERIRVVVNPDLREHIEALGMQPVLQEPQLGTGHAVRLALDAPPAIDGPVLIISADMPLIPEALIDAVITSRDKSDAAVAMVTARVPLPSFFGRIVRSGGQVVRVIEQKDATPEQLQNDEVNAGIYCFEQIALREALAKLQPNNVQAELYLTDCIAAISDAKGRVVTFEAGDYRDVTGINNRIELANARAIMQHRILEQHMLAGVTVVDPSSTYIDADVSVEPDAVIHPQTHLHGRTSVGRGSIIGPNTVIVNTSVGEGAQIVQSAVKDSIVGADVTIGPFAHLRGSTILEQGVHIGNFVELKNTRMGKGVKAGHLSYLGDSEVGDGANIGAGTITCNYDGKRKHKTKIGKSAFIGSNSSLVAPVEIGDGSLTGAGSVVLHDVPAGERVAGNPAKPLPKKQVAESK